MAHTKAIGTTQLGRDSRPKYRGLKLHDGQLAKAGSIIVRQTGSSFWPGEGVRQGSDYTIYAVITGKVKFTTKLKKNYDGSRKIMKIVNVVAK
ncbi:MAG: 50S ribosomal protein L27 [Patescibacteria group bacterium]